MQGAYLAGFSSDVMLQFRKFRYGNVQKAKLLFLVWARGARSLFCETTWPWC